MQLGNQGFLLDERGRRLAINELPQLHELDLDESASIDWAIRQGGFVRIQRAYRAIFVELCPSRVAPLAALEAFYEIKGAAAECVILACFEYPQKLPHNELFFIDAALKKVKEIARMAGRRAAVDLRARSACFVIGGRADQFAADA